MSALSTNDIIKRFEAQQAEAQKANARQFDQLISTIKGLQTQTGGTFAEALQRLEGLGATARERVERSGQRAFAQGQQDLISSGLAGSTLTPNLRRAVGEDVAFQQSAIDEQVGAQQAGVLTQRAGSEAQLGGLLANAIGSQRNIGPDLGLFASLLQSAAAAGTGQKSNVFVPPTSAQVNAPNTFGTRPGGGGGSGSTTSLGPQGNFQTGGTGGPSGPARIVTNPNARPSPLSGAPDTVTARALSRRDPRQNQEKSPCPPGLKLFRGIGCF